MKIEGGLLIASINANLTPAAYKKWTSIADDQRDFSYQRTHV